MAACIILGCKEISINFKTLPIFFVRWSIIKTKRINVSDLRGTWWDAHLHGWMDFQPPELLLKFDANKNTKTFIDACFEIEFYNFNELTSMGHFFRLFCIRKKILDEKSHKNFQFWSVQTVKFNHSRWPFFGIWPINDSFSLAYSCVKPYQRDSLEELFFFSSSYDNFAFRIQCTCKKVKNNNHKNSNSKSAMQNRQELCE